MSLYYALCKMDSDFVKHSRKALKEDFRVGLKNLDSMFAPSVLLSSVIKSSSITAMAAEERDPDNFDSSLDLRSRSEVVSSSSNLYPF